MAPEPPSELEALRAQLARLEDLNRRLAAAEAANTAQQTLITRILEAVPGGIVHVGAMGDIRLANEAACSILGLRFDKLTRRYTTDFAGATVLEDGTACPPEAYPVSRCLMTGQAQPPMTIGVRQPSGKLRWAIFTAIPAPVDEGGGAVVTFVDITERREAELERREMVLRVARAERLASLGTLAAGLAHELNNPLTFILGNLEVALDSCGPEQARMARCLEDAQTGALRISRVVRDFRAFASRDEVASGPFLVQSAIDRAVDMTRAQLRQRAALEVVAEEGVLAIGQEIALAQALVHLLNNAALACPMGHAAEHQVRVEVKTEGGDVLISVIDDGCGMPAETLRQAFDPFFTTRPVGSGSGLGLSIAHGAIAGMGGSIDLDSRPDVGTVATVRLTAATEAARAKSGAGPGQGPRVDLPRVLVVDDEAGVREVIRMGLRRCAVTPVASGREALSAIAHQSFDVVLLDLVMPDLSGIEVYAHLEAHHPELCDRVVLITGGSHTAELREFVARVDLPRLNKPFGLSELRRAVHAVADRRKA